ncbi:MAG: hypothetical protein JW850_06635 [Thermoflexales bacterium]|nr:hypothetical protein [Thermoflexales bacterium]
MQFLKKLFEPSSVRKDVIIVSGLPRSGTSMMMKMLEAGGLEIVSDHLRTADEDNPKGYYEFERAKKLPEGDTAWLDEARGKVVKVISELVKHLPPTHNYKVLFMRRTIGEILASQQKMLERRGKAGGAVSDEEMAALFDKHLKQVYAWMDGQPNLAYLDVDYNQMLREPRPILRQIKRFLGEGLDVDKMAAVADPSLYRQRRI